MKYIAAACLVAAGQGRRTTAVELQWAPTRNQSSGLTVFCPERAAELYGISPRGAVVLCKASVPSLRWERYLCSRRAHRVAHVLRTEDWYGAAPDSSMTHIAIQEGLNGKVVDWMEPVSEQEYQEVRR